MMPQPTRSFEEQDTTFRVVRLAVGVVLVLGIVAMLFASSACAPSPTDDSTVPLPTANPGPDPAPHYSGNGLNARVQDGQIQLTVTRIQCGVKQVGSGSLSRIPKGEYCLVSITAKNVGDEPAIFYSENQYAYDAGRQRYIGDSSADHAMADKGFLAAISPTNEFAGVIAFDLPQNTLIVHLELHESARSIGITLAFTSSDISFVD
jgi:hypothetical protein